MIRTFLLLCNRPAFEANAETITNHLDALSQLEDFTVHELSMIGSIPKGLDLNRFDGIGIHYTLHLSDPQDHFLDKISMERIAHFKGLKCVWIHDEYRRVSSVGEKLQHMGIDIIFSLASSPIRELLYPKSLLPNARLETVYAGYIPQDWDKIPLIPIAQRPITVGYRARRPPYWLGKLGQEKINIGLDFKRRTQDLGLTSDISVEEEDRLYGTHWRHFLGQCQTVLCVESGSSIIDFTGEIEITLEKEVQENPYLSFEELWSKYLKEIDGKHIINPISPRVFEAAIMKTVMVAFEGDYSGLLKSWSHYIPLKKDFSNIKDVIKAIRDGGLLEEIAHKTYQDLVVKGDFSYATLIRQCSVVMKEEMQKKDIFCMDKRGYTAHQFKRTILKSPSYLYRHYGAHFLQSWLLGTWLRTLLIRLWQLIPPVIKERLRPFLKIIGR